MLTEGILTTHDVGIAVHLLGWCVRSRSTVFIFREFKSFPSRLVYSVSREQYLDFSKICMSINSANRIAVEIHKSSVNSYFDAGIISNQIDSVTDSTSK